VSAFAILDWGRRQGGGNQWGASVARCSSKSARERVCHCLIRGTAKAVEISGELLLPGAPAKRA
jgi:hypothetical protein